MSKTQTRIAVALENIHLQLRVLNQGRDAFHREVLEVLTAAKAVPAKQCWKTKRGPQPVVGEAFVYRCVLELGHDGKCTDGERMEWT